MDPPMDGRSVKDLKSFFSFFEKRSSYKFGSVSLLSTCYRSSAGYRFLGIPRLLGLRGLGFN